MNELNENAKPYSYKEWIKLFQTTPYEQHHAVLFTIGFFRAVDRGPEYLESLNLSPHLRNSMKDLEEGNSDWDLSRLAHTGFTDEEYELIMMEEWRTDEWAKAGLEHYKYLD